MCDAAVHDVAIHADDYFNRIICILKLIMKLVNYPTLASYCCCAWPGLSERPAEEPDEAAIWQPARGDDNARPLRPLFDLDKARNPSFPAGIERPAARIDATRSLPTLEEE